MSTAGSTPSAPPLDAELQRLLERCGCPISAAPPRSCWPPPSATLDPAEYSKRFWPRRFPQTVRAGHPPSPAGSPPAKPSPPGPGAVVDPGAHPVRAAHPEWIHRRKPGAAIGTGKTFLLEALPAAVEAGCTACQPRSSPRWRRHRADDTVTKAITKIRAPTSSASTTSLLIRHAASSTASRRRLQNAQSLSSNLHPITYQDTGHRHRRPTATPRPRLPNQRRQRAPHPSPGRQGGERLDITPGHVRWPRTSRSRGHHRADLVAVYGQILMSLDTPFSARSPRSPKRRPDPTTRSLTVLDTRT